MNPTELRAGATLAGVFGLRMLGLFSILPCSRCTRRASRAATTSRSSDRARRLRSFAGDLADSVRHGIGPLGRKPVIYVGLVIFAAGSFLAAAADDIWTAIAGRTLQGAGAISSVVVALAADLTREQHRTKVMAMIGAMIGFAFALSLVAAPALRGHRNGRAFRPDRRPLPRRDGGRQDARARRRRTGAARRGQRKGIFDIELLRLNFGIFVLHMVQMAMFVVLPPLLVTAGLPGAEHWKLYLPVVLASFALMVPPVLLADRRNRPKPVMLGAVALLLAVQTGLAFMGTTLAALAVLLLAFFAAFNVLEALLPSLVSRIAPAHARGAAIGVYNTTQTLGLFFGGLMGGWVADRYGVAAVFTTCALLAALWGAVAAGMRPLRTPVNELSSLTFSIAAEVDLDGLSEALARVRGVREAEIVPAERIARLKVVPGQWDEHRVRQLITGEV